MPALHLPSGNFHSSQHDTFVLAGVLEKGEVFLRDTPSRKKFDILSVLESWTREMAPFCSRESYSICMACCQLPKFAPLHSTLNRVWRTGRASKCTCGASSGLTASPVGSSSLPRSIAAWLRCHSFRNHSSLKMTSSSGSIAPCMASWPTPRPCPKKN